MFLAIVELAVYVDDLFSEVVWFVKGVSNA
jgi:hypothetical protein